jgi:simple sugar transport system permease protein
MSLRIEARPQISRQLLYLTPLLAVALTVVAGFFIFLLMGYNPLAALYHFFISPLTRFYGLSELGVKAAPLIIIGVGLAIGFRANVWNIGAEGQLTVGAIAGGGIALAFWGEEGVWILPLMALAGILGGMAYAAIPAFLKTRLGVNEILTSLMLTYVATLLLSMMVYGPWKDPAGFGFPQSRLFTDSALLPMILEGTRLHLGAVAAVLIAVAAWVVMTCTVIGFEIRVVGQAPAAAAGAWPTTLISKPITVLVMTTQAATATSSAIRAPRCRRVPSRIIGSSAESVNILDCGKPKPCGSFQGP